MQIHRSVMVFATIATLLVLVPTPAAGLRSGDVKINGQGATDLTKVNARLENQKKPVVEKEDEDWRRDKKNNNQKKWEPQHVKDYDTKITIKACNSQPNPPGPRQAPICHKEQQHHDEFGRTNGNATTAPVACQILDVIPGRCSLGYSISCFFFKHCLASQFYPMSSQCAGQHVQQVFPCDNNFSPVLPGCEYYRCNETAYVKHKCIPKDGPNVPPPHAQELTPLEAHQQKQKDAHRALHQLVRNVAKVDGSSGDDTTESKVSPANKKHDGFFHGLERNCTHDVKCSNSPGMDFDKCTEIGQSSVHSTKLVGTMKPGKPFKNCGWVVISKWHDQLCRGRPESEYAVHTNECNFGQDPFKAGQFAALEIVCSKKANRHH